MPPTGPQTVRLWLALFFPLSLSLSLSLWLILFYFALALLPVGYSVSTLLVLSEHSS